MLEIRSIIIVVLAVPAIGADLPCADCHPKEVQGYRQSAMAHSLSEVTSQPDGTFEHALSRTRFSIRSNPSGMLQRFERDSVSAEQRVAAIERIQQLAMGLSLGGLKVKALINEGRR